jgi:serine/threonine protein kinase
MDIIAGKYKVLRELGEGSSGKVYLVEHTDLAVKYALKVLDNSLADHQRFIDRFKREAEVLLRFTHEGSIQLRDFGRVDDGRYYMAMDYCPGEVLKKIIQKHGAFTADEAFDILMQLLKVLDAAHKEGIIHRDIKPDNIMLQYSSAGKIVVKILDFGIAKLKESIEKNMSTTIEGASIGTPYYMSPEQASGEADLDNRVDLYAAGIVFYELLSGQVPFKGKTVLQTLLMHLTHTAEPIAKNLGLPEFIDTFIIKALEKRKEDRFQNAKEFSEECLKTFEQFNEWKQSRTMQEQFKTNAKALQAAGKQNSTSGKTRILCLDDNEMILNILKHILEQQGYEIYTSSNCAGIHDYLFNDGVKLLISDVEMPDMRGTRVCSMLKQSLPDLKIVLFSNIPERELEKASAECKADGWISKNARPQEWLAKIQEMTK